MRHEKKNMGKIIIVAQDLGHLKRIIKKEIEAHGNECDLNHIDISQITSLGGLFSQHKDFNGNVSKWNTSNVQDMSRMFNDTKFNGDISQWDVSKVKNIREMFSNSAFNNDISQWDTSNVEVMSYLFNKTSFNQDISKWNTSNVKDMGYMFNKSEFNRDISGWDVSNVEYMDHMFLGSKFSHDLNHWRPTSLIKNIFMFEDCPAPKTYWSLINGYEEIQDAIKKHDLYLILEDNITQKDKNLKMKI